LNRELGREDSNLQLPKSRGRRAAHRPKARKKLTDARDAKQASRAENGPRNRYQTVIGIRALEDVPDAELHLPA